MPDRRPARVVLSPVVLDVGLGVVATGLVAFAAWGPPRVAGSPIEGPLWLRAVLPFILGLPLAARRRHPLLVWTVLWGAIVFEVLVTSREPATLGVTIVLLVSSYALGAHASLRRALLGLAVGTGGMVIAALCGHGWSGQIVVGTYLVVAHASGTPVLVTEVLALWLAGVAIRIRREAAASAARNEALDRAAERAVVAERARIAREMHDIVAHHLSVVVLQAAGARAAGSPTPEVLEKIEHSGRLALTETRQLLGVLRGSDGAVELAPQPGIAALPALVASVSKAGLPVDLVVEGNGQPVPAAIDVSTYRIVQEALTNALKHAGPASARVAIDCGTSSVAIEVRDDGRGASSVPPSSLGHGLIGMRERVAVLGGELRVGPEPGRGFAVHATLPLG